MDKKTFVTVFLIMLLSLFLNVYKKDFAPPCFNADEAAFGYNTYSILKTGKDEYGTTLPLRLKSFGDYKMPLYSYLSMPFIGIMGLNESATRMLNTVLAFMFPLAVFLLARELFSSTRASLIAALLASVSIGLQSISRQAHEGYLLVFLVTLASYFFIRLLKNNNPKNQIGFFTFLILSLFSYQSARIFAVFFFVASFIYFLSTRFVDQKAGSLVAKRQITLGFLAVFLVLLFGVFAVDLKYSPTRVNTLLFWNNKGFSLAINELRGEGGSRLVYNKVTQGIRTLVNEHFTYFSPQFLVTEGDENPRFGLPGMSPITAVEYVFFFVGLYYLFKTRNRFRFLLFALLIVSPLPASLSWAHASLTRSLFLLVPVIAFSAFGIDQLLSAIPQSKRPLFLILFIPSFLFFLFFSWDFYLNHYPKKALTVSAWQCGYKELGTYVKQNYDKFDTVFITRENGQPYIFLLFYLAYPPEKYQKIARLSSPDKYGFGQVEQFDKYVFTATPGVKPSTYALIAYPHDLEIYDQSSVKHITVNGEEIFQIFETQR